MRFKYLRDPLFLVCVLIYFVNRFVLKRLWESGFVHEHLNDLICIPFWVPIMLWAQRAVGLRDTDEPPRAYEIMVALVMWSWLFEVVLPGWSCFNGRCVADHLDIVFYSAGALLGAIIWTRQPATTPPST